MVVELRQAAFGWLAGPSGATAGTEPVPGGGSIARSRYRCSGIGTGGAISRRDVGSFGFQLSCVLDDVGVRLGGSEHHRIEISSSHTRPPPFGAGAPGHRDRACGVSRDIVSPVPLGAGPTDLLGERAAASHRGSASGAFRGIASRASPGSGKWRSSEHRAPSLDRDREPGPLRSDGPPSHLDRASGALWNTARPVPPRQGSSILFGGWTDLSRPRPESLASMGQPPGPAGVRRTVLFGAPPRRASPRGREPGPLRSNGPPTPPGTGQAALFGASHVSFHPGQGTRTSSEDRLLVSSGSGWSCPTGTEQAVLFGVSGAQSRRDGSPPPGAGRSRLFGAS
jgi:hypothetical protein